MECSRCATNGIIIKLQGLSLEITYSTKGKRKLIESLAGLLNFIIMVMPRLRPLLAPLYVLLAATAAKHTVIWPLHVKRVIKHLTDTIVKHPQRKIPTERWIVPGCVASDGSGGVYPLTLATRDVVDSFTSCFQCKLHFSSSSRPGVSLDPLSVLAFASSPRAKTRTVVAPSYLGSPGSLHLVLPKHGGHRWVVVSIFHTKKG